MSNQPSYPYYRPKYLLQPIWTLLFLLLAACGPSESITATPGAASLTQNTPTFSEAYPGVGSESQGYPGQTITFETVPTEAGYPPAGQNETPLPGPHFQFDAILQAGQVRITGQAPPNLSLAILDITFNGVILGVGFSDENGRFDILVSALPVDHRVGITIGELSPGKTMEEMSTALYPYRGDGFMNVPNLGIFFETALVQP